MRLRVRTPEDLVWSLGTQDGTPYYLVGAGRHQRQVKVDPYPAYPADKGIVAELLAECVERFPLKGLAELVILPHDFIDRVNGMTFEDSDYGRNISITWHDGEKGETYPQIHTIVLAAKRIPIHPAMLRYLVPHEYGHAVFNRIAVAFGYRQHEHETLEAAYMRLRGGVRQDGPYRGGKWHLTAGEIIANDFRVLVMGREPEFWPHPRVRPPTLDARIVRWWREAFERCGAPWRPARGLRRAV